MSRATRLSAVLVTLVLAAACSTRELVRIEDESLFTPNNVSLEQVQQEIKQAARKRGWKVVNLMPGKLKATFEHKRYAVVVEIAHTTETMSIRYRGSRNLRYNGTKIHKSANKWIRDLRSTIVKHTSRMVARKSAPQRTIAGGDPTPERPIRPPEKPPGKLSTGTGFFVSANGHILTNLHVVNGCRTTRASTAGMLVPTGMTVSAKPTGAPKLGEGGKLGGSELEILGVDARNDLALLKSAQTSSEIASFRGGRGVRTGDDIVVTGFPLHGLLASDISVTKGIVSALAGPGNNRGMIQITAPVQPGNSGGPVLDTSGNVVGVVVGKLNAIKIADATGSFPENVNFAVSQGTARAFLDAHSIPYQTTRSDSRRHTADIVARAKGYTVLIKCRK